MELDNIQEKIIRSKPFGLSMVKGDTGSGKTTAAIYRMLHLKNNYCLYDDDGILMVNCGTKDLGEVIANYKTIEEASNFDYLSLFSNSRDNVHIYDLESIVQMYYDEYIKDNNIKFKVLNHSILKEDIIKECIIELQGSFKNSKLLNCDYRKFFIEEIMWIKSCNYLELEEYQQAVRLGRKYPKGEGPQRILKNSKNREIIFEIMKAYNRRLNDMGYVDKEDMVLFALKQAKQKPSHLYTHLIIDESEKLTRSEIELLRALSHNKIYSSFMFLLNQNIKSDSNSWLIKGRKQNTLGFGVSGKSYGLKNLYTKKEDEVNMDELIEIDEKTNVSFVESYNYIDIRHNRVFEFSIDTSKTSEIILKHGDEEQVLEEEELKDIPVYSDIAAGEPILMNSEIEANFYLPQYWLKGINDCFMLKVKGDSMKEANIENGDFVVIRKQYNANNRDIVAVDIDGASTLKRLSLGKGGPTLLPENPKYSPIPLYGKDAKILGVAVGVLKNSNQIK
jgi:SOS regulatory protein LexA